MGSCRRSDQALDLGQLLWRKAWRAVSILAPVLVTVLAVAALMGVVSLAEVVPFVNMGSERSVGSVLAWVKDCGRVMLSAGNMNLARRAQSTE